MCILHQAHLYFSLHPLVRIAQPQVLQESQDFAISSDEDGEPAVRISAILRLHDLSPGTCLLQEVLNAHGGTRGFNARGALRKGLAIVLVQRSRACPTAMMVHFSYRRKNV